MFVKDEELLANNNHNIAISRVSACAGHFYLQDKIFLSLFIDEETGSQKRLGDLPKITELAGNLGKF